MPQSPAAPECPGALPQDVAERVAREAKQRHFQPRVVAMDAYALAELPAEQLVVLVASTTGQVPHPSRSAPESHRLQQYSRTISAQA